MSNNGDQGNQNAVIIFAILIILALIGLTK